MFVEKQPAKILSSVGAICKKGLNIDSLYVAPSELWIYYLPVFYKYDTPLGLKSLKLVRMGVEI